MRIRSKTLWASVMGAMLVAVMSLSSAFAAMTTEDDVKFLQTHISISDAGVPVPFFIKDAGLNTTSEVTIAYNLEQPAAQVTTLTAVAAPAGNAQFNLAAGGTYSLTLAVPLLDIDGDGCVPNDVVVAEAGGNAGGGGTATTVAFAAGSCSQITVTTGNAAFVANDTITLAYAAGWGAGTAQGANAINAGTALSINTSAAAAVGSPQTSFLIAKNAVLTAVTEVKDNNNNVYNVATVNQNGTFTLSGAIPGAATSLTIKATVHDVNQYLATTDAGKRVKVTSTSDTAGEWIAITEINDDEDNAGGNADGTVDVLEALVNALNPVGIKGWVTNAVVNGGEGAANSGNFFGVIKVSSNAGSIGQGDGKIWAKDGDVITVTYYGPTGATTVVDTATITVDGTAPSIDSVTPATGLVTSGTIPIVQVTVSDAGAGFVAGSPSSFVTITVGTDSAGDCGYVIAAPAFTSATSSKIEGIYSAPATWLTTHQRVDANANMAFNASGALTGGCDNNDRVGIPQSGTGYWKVTVTDKSGNTSSKVYSITIDTTKPLMGAATTGVACVDNVEKTGVNTSIGVVFTDTNALGIDGATVDAADFTVDGVAPSAATMGTSSVCSANKVYLTVPALASDATPKVVLVGSVADKAGNAVSLTTAADVTKTAADGLKPVISDFSISATQLSTKLGVTESTISFSVDETVATPVVNATLNNGTVLAATITSPAPKTYNAKFTAANLGTGAHVVAITVKDVSPAQNKAVYGKSTTTYTYTSAVADNNAATETNVFIGTALVADTDGDGALIDEFAYSVNGTSTVVAGVEQCATRAYEPWGEDNAVGGAGDNADGHLDFDDNANADNACDIDNTDVVVITANTTSVVIEVDNTAPTKSSTTPNDNASVEKKGVTYVTVVMSDSDFLSDTQTKLTLKSATLNGDAVTLSSADGKTWVLALTDAPLGSHVLKAKFTDASGNDSSEVVLNFKVTAKSAYSLSINPGWNLISLPGDPADSSIGAVLTGTEVSTVVAYIAGEWKVAINEGGSWSGALTNIVSGNGYWLESPAPATIKTVLGDVSPTASIPTIPVIKGWNLVGITDLSQQAAGGNPGGNATSAATYFGSGAASFYSYNTVGSSWTKVASNGNVVTGKGYWVWYNAAGNIVP